MSKSPILLRISVCGAQELVGDGAATGTRSIQRGIDARRCHSLRAHDAYLFHCCWCRWSVPLVALVLDPLRASNHMAKSLQVADMRGCRCSCCHGHIRSAMGTCMWASKHSCIWFLAYLSPHFLPHWLSIISVAPWWCIQCPNILHLLTWTCQGLKPGVVFGISVTIKKFS